ncbi:MAG: hypothetical protein ABIZ80_24130 [Bryobacteraceae bacterium]
MKREIASIVVAAGLGASCTHHMPAPAFPVVAAKPAMDRQIANAVDAGEGDYIVRELRAKMSADPGNLAVRLDLIRHYNQVGYPEVALEHSRLAAERFPDSAEVQLLLARSLRGMKMPAEAASGLALFLEKHPQISPEYDSWLGILWDELGDWAQGERFHRSALALGDIDYLHNNLGYNLLRQDKRSEAAFEFRQALKLKPGSEVARNNLGLALAEKPSEAVLHWQSISDPATAHSNMAAILIEEGRYADARKEIDLALGYNRTHTAALNNLRLVSELDGKPAVIPLKQAQKRWDRIRVAVKRAVVGG